MGSCEVDTLHELIHQLKSALTSVDLSAIMILIYYDLLAYHDIQLIMIYQIVIIYHLS